MSEPTLDLRAISTPAAWDGVAGAYARLLADHLGLYAVDALRLADIKPGEWVLDVATGPGTLALPAARITSVHALDFSHEMLNELRARATEAEQTNLRVQQGDGQALPYDSATFDAAFSMFGLFMFPRRDLGFSELARVVKPGGRAVVASWQPQTQVPFLSAIGQAVAELAGPGPDGGQPLADPTVFAAEMSAAGFDVQVHGITHTLHSPTRDALWASMQDSHVALRLARQQLVPSDYGQLIAGIEARLQDRFDAGPQAVEMPAWLAVGRVPST